MNEMINLRGQDGELEQLKGEARKIMQEVAPDYGGTEADVQRAALYVLKQLLPAEKQSTEVPLNEVQNRILDALVSRLSMKDIRPKVIDTKSGMVIGEAGSKEDVRRFAGEERGSMQ